MKIEKSSYISIDKLGIWGPLQTRFLPSTSFFPTTDKVAKTEYQLIEKRDLFTKENC